MSSTLSEGMARMFAELLGSIVYIERLAHQSMTDFVVVAGPRALLVTVIGFDPGTSGTHGVAVVRRVDVMQRFLRVGADKSYLAMFDSPIAADELAVLLVSAEGLATLRCPRAELDRAPTTSPLDGTVTVAFKTRGSTTPTPARRDVN